MKIIRLLFLFFAVSVFSQSNLEVANFNFPKIKSSIVMPVTVPLSEISNLVNSSVKDLIYEDDSYTDNGNDQFKVKVWKTRAIRLVGDANGNVLIEVPLKVWAEKGIGALGVYTYQNTTFEAVMYFKTAVGFQNNWTITTTTQPMGYKWVKKPVLDYGKIKIPITSLVESSLKDQQAKFCKIIDQQMASQLNFQQYAVLAWNAFAQPFSISEEYNTWLKVTPITVNITSLKFSGNQIDTNIGIDVFSETFTGSKPVASALLNKVPNFNSVSQLSNQFNLQTTANIPFSEATQIAQKMFLGKDFDIRDSKMKIEDIKVYADDDRIMIEAQTEGYVKGTAFISGIPVYNETKKKIVLTDTKFKLKTSNFFQKAAVLLFKGKIIKLIEDEYGIPTEELEVTSKKSIEEAFNKEYYKGLKMNGKVLSLKPNNILIGESGITVVIDTSATLNLIFQGL